MDEILRQFLIETTEGLALLDRELVKLDLTPDDPAARGKLFDFFLKVKGTCGFLGLTRLEGVAHASENMLGKIQDGALAATPGAVNLILESLDRIKSLLSGLEQAEAEPAGDDSDLICQLNGLAEDVAAADTQAGPITPRQIELVQTTFAKIEPIAETAATIFYDRLFFLNPKLQALFKGDIEEQGRKLMSLLKLAVNGLRNLDKLVPAVEDLGRRHATYGVEKADYGTVGSALLWTLEEGLGMSFTPEVQEAWTAVYTVLARIMQDAAHRDTAHNSVAAPDDAAAPPAAPAANPQAAAAAATPVPQPPAAAPLSPAPAEATETAGPSVATQSIRVGVDVLENLMTMVSELVLTRNQLLQILRTQKDTDFASPLQRLNHVTSELQEGVMKTRMQPVGNAWSKLPRLVRDLSHELGKKIDLQMRGEETELDRQVLELIKDPLTHLVRNCADHGLEVPADRKQAGKPETGRLTLNAFHEGGHIVIEVSDDGRGLPLDKIRAKALADKLATEAELAAMSDQQAMQLIFRAGFSTAAQVTSVSGRGVGMDVVRTNVEKIGGTVELKSAAGKGTSFIIKIPLTLAIVSALIVECSKERFAIPQISVLELVRAVPGSETRIERINDAAVLRLRNRLLPLVSLGGLLKLNDEKAKDAAETFIVVTQVGNNSFGIMVDRVFDTEEIVVKPVAPILRDVEMFSGNTILGDGSVIMILDPNGIAAALGDNVRAEVAVAVQVAGTGVQENERVTLLVFRAGGGAPKAVPLSLIARLEEVEGASVEFGDGRPVVQYRGKLMPLVAIDPSYEIKRQGRQPILVFTDGGQTMGLLVDEIVDIVEERLSIEMSAKLPSLVGSAIVAGKSTDIIDTGHYLRQAYPDWFGTVDRRGRGAAKDGKKLLLVDDSSFFRNLLAPLLSTAGYEVTAAESADQALDLCEAGCDFDVIISDIEMPGMDGFQFAETVRKGRWQDTPLVALTSRATPQDIERGRAVGFTDYIAKLNREALLRTLSETTATARGAA